MKVYDLLVCRWLSAGYGASGSRRVVVKTLGSEAPRGQVTFALQHALGGTISYRIDLDRRGTHMCTLAFTVWGRSICRKAIGELGLVADRGEARRTGVAVRPPTLQLSDDAHALRAGREPHGRGRLLGGAC